MTFTKHRLTFAITLAMSNIILAEEAQNTEIELESVKIYGQKQVTNLQDTTASIGLLTADQIEKSTIQDINDVFGRTANVVSISGGNESLFAIRGVSIYGPTDNPVGYTASLYVDDAPMNIDSIRYGAMGLWDIEQVEIYRGPQGTLQGRNSLAGAIHLKTTDPTQEWGGKAQLSVAEYGTQRLSVAGGGALNDEFSIRLAADTYQSDGYIDNITRNEDDYAGFERNMYRAKLKYQPKAISNLSALLTVSRHDSKIGDQPMARSDDPFSYEAQSDHDSQNDVITDTAALKVNLAINSNLEFTSVTTISTDEYDRVDDYDSSAVAFGVIDQNNTGETISQELRLNFTTGDISGVAGLYYAQSENNQDWVADSKYPKALQQDTAYAALASFGLDTATSDAVWGVIPDLVDLVAINDSEYKTNNYAVFGEVNWQASEALTLTVGARYDYEEQKRDQVTNNNINTVVDTGGPYDATANQLLGGLASVTDQKTDTDYDAFLPKLSAQYALTEDMKAGFTIQQGYRAGGSSVSLASGVVADFDPEYTTNYELSLRSQFMDGAITANANVFYTDWKDQQIDVELNGDSRNTIIQNAGESNLYGAELELSAFVSSQVEVFSSVGFIETEYETGEFKGNEFANAPDMTATLGTVFRSFGGIFASIDGNYQSESFVDNDNTEARKLDGRTTVNAKVGFETYSWSAYVWATNVTDEEYLVNNWNSQNIGVVEDYNQPGAPRMIGASFVTEF